MKDQPIILAVDDELNILKLLSVNLIAEGFQVVTASDGTSALTMLETYHPDLVLLDIMMPDFNGFVLIDLIRERSNVPIIMLTARDDFVSLRRALDTGADDYLTKPFSVQVLSARIHAKLKRNDDVAHR